MQVTWHVRRAVLIRRASYAQLAVAIATPALDSASRYDHARVVIPQGNGGGGYA
jgi:hypothetical protein